MNLQRDNTGITLKYKAISAVDNACWCSSPRAIVRIYSSLGLVIFCLFVSLVKVNIGTSSSKPRNSNFPYQAYLKMVQPSSIVLAKSSTIVSCVLLLLCKIFKLVTHYKVFDGICFSGRR